MHPLGVDWLARSVTEGHGFYDRDNLRWDLRFEGSGLGLFGGDIAVAATNSIFFDSGSNTYIQEDAADNLRMVVGGTERFNANSSGIQVVNAITATTNITAGGYVIGQSATGGTGIYLDSTDSFTSGTLYTPGLRWREADGTSVAGIRGAVTASGNSLILGTGWLDAEVQIFPSYVDFANDVRVSNQIQVGVSVIHEGDTDTGMAFNTNEIVFSTGGGTRLTLNGTASTFPGSVIAADYRATGGAMLKHYSAGWTTPIQTAIYAGYQAGTGDYIYLKSPGNSNDQGILAVGDTGLWYGDTNDQTGGGLANDATNPFSNNSGAVKFRVNSAGDGYFTGDSNAVDHNNTSDVRLKKNIRPIENALDIVRQLNPIIHEWIDGKDGDNFGFIAQEVESIAPTLVSKREDEMLLVNYVKSIPLLTKALQEILDRLEALEAK